METNQRDNLIKIYYPLPPTARQTRSGVNGASMWRTPVPDSPFQRLIQRQRQPLGNHAF